MTSLFPPFNRRSSFRKQPYFFEAGRGVNYKPTGGPFPSLDLNFLSGTLDPRITFSRASNATLTDATGKITYAPNNLLLQSQAWATSPWAATVGGVAATPTVTNNYAVAPDGTATATRLQLSLNGGTTTTDLALVRQSATFTSGLSLFSFYAKSTDGNSYVCQIINPDGAGSNITITNTWQRFTSSILTATGSVNYGIRLRGGQSPANSNTADLLVWGAQVEAVTYQTTPSTYNATTTAAYYGPRFDYDPITLAAKGLLIEEARTNLLTYSEQFDNAGWTKTRTTISANAITAPDGTLTADKLVETATTGQHLCGQSAGSQSAGAFVFSVYIKAGERFRGECTVGSSVGGANGFYASFNLNTGTATLLGQFGTGFTGVSASLTNTGNGWYRFALAGTTSSTGTIAGQINLYDNSGALSYTGDGTSGFYLWGAQLEAGAFATSYIPTTSAAVTRSADAALMTGSNFSSWYNASAGTFWVLFDGPASGTKAIIAADNNTSSNNIQLYTSSTDPKFLVADGGVAQADIDAGTVAATTQYKFAGAYAADNFAASIAGGAAVTDTSGTVPTVDRLRIGTNQAGNYLSGHVATIKYYNTRISDAKLQVLTS